MEKKTKRNIKEVSLTLMIILCITCIVTIFTEVYSISQLIEEISFGGVWEEQISQVIITIFYILIQLTAINMFYAIHKTGIPFLPIISRNSKIIGGLIMFAPCISMWSGGIISLVANESGTVTMFDNSILLGLIIGLIFACLGEIFDYGCQLQKQDDELL